MQTLYGLCLNLDFIFWSLLLLSGFCFVLFALRGQAQGTYNDFLNVFLTFIYNLLQSGNKAIFLC